MEEILEPQRPICDPHHHLWDHPGRRYLIDELLADTGSGHNVVATVFVRVHVHVPRRAARRRCGRSARPSSSTASPP